MVYIIKVINGGGYEIYGGEVEARNENEALMELLKNAIINTEDTITITEAD